jgi:4,4'-diaponeurosporenoate glycosyltransferase
MLAAIMALWLLGWLMLFRIPLCRRDPARAAYPTLSVIVPARNEEHNLPRLLQSLERQEPRPLEVLVVDDGSTDRTAAIAREGGATVLRSAPLPDGWRGKTWACHQGAGAARSEVLLFVDADTAFEPGGLRAVFDTYLRGEGVLSVGAYHTVPAAHEQFSAFFNLFMTIGVGAFTILGARRTPCGLFGPFLMLDRQSYARGGGHAAVRGDILENLFMARRFRALGIPLRCFGGRGTFCMRMYPGGFRDLVEGWSKAFATGAGQTPAWLLALSTAWIGGALLVAAMAGAAVAGREASSWPWLGVYGLFALQITTWFRRIGSFRVGTGLAYPVPLLFYLAVFARAAWRTSRRRSVSWKGRSIPAAGQKETVSCPSQ